MRNRDMPAKPQPLATDHDGNIYSSGDKSKQDSGLTKLEYAAIQIMSGFSSINYFGEMPIKEKARLSLEHANALFDELEKNNETNR